MQEQQDLFAEPLPKHCQRLHPLAPQPQPQETGEQLKRKGMQAAESAKIPMVAIAREIAVDIARGVSAHADGRLRADGLCTADDVAAQFEREGREWIGNAAGRLFLDGNWEEVGMTESVRPHAHKNPIRIWRRKHG